MARSLKLRVFVGSVGLLLLAASAARAQVTIPIAQWRFEQGNFLADTSGNANNLMQGGGTSQAIQQAGSPAGGTGSAHFDGSAVLRTAAPLNLIGVQHIRITWSQANQALALVTPRPFFALTNNFAATIGAFRFSLNSNLADPANQTTQGDITLTGQSPITELFPHNSGAAVLSWQTFTADINLAQAAISNIAVFDANLVPIGVPLTQAVAPVSFNNGIFYIGSGDNTPAGSNSFIGNLDEISIDQIANNAGGIIPGPGGGGGNNTGGTGGIGTGGLISSGFGGGGTSGANGVIVDAEGVLRMKHFADPGGQLTKKRVAEARAHLHPDIAKPSKLRKVSLNRLEAAIRGRLEAGKPPVEEMQYLAGLTRVRYVFYYPETKDIVLAGPAEGWASDLSGRVCGLDSGRPVLQLQDLVVALRAFSPGGKPAPVILCSIDPTAEGLARMQQFLRGVGSQITPDDTEMIVDGLRTNLGMQNIRVGGVAPNTHFAQVLLECDYRMKLIGIGLEKPPVRMVSYVDAAKPGGSRNALTRWYFIPDYKCVRTAADNLGLELTGDIVKLVTEDQIVAQDGGRSATGKTNKASDVFTKTFTQKYAELAVRVPVFAEMRNVIDLAIAAAFIRQQDFYGQSSWRADTFNDENKLAVETHTTPQQVETVCTAVWKGSRLMTPVGGGVTIHPQQALQSKNTQPDEDGKVSEARETIGIDKIAPDRWWWD